MEALVDNELLPGAVECELQPIENIQTEVGCVSLRGNAFDVFEDPPVELEVNNMGFVKHCTTIIICDEDLAESSRAQVWDKSAGTIDISAPVSTLNFTRRLRPCIGEMMSIGRIGAGRVVRE